MKVIDLSHQKNVRDLGGLVGHDGKKVKFGRIYRGGYLGRLSDKDIAIVETLNITDVIDFRGRDEFISRPDHPFKNMTFHNYPAMKNDVRKEDSITEDSNLLWFLPDEHQGFKHMYDLYPYILFSEIGLKAYTDFFNLLTSKPDGVFYFHCSQGKDRAGLAAYLLEIALGVNEEVAREDYLYSNIAMKEKIAILKEQLKDQSFYCPEYERSLEEVFSADIRYLDHAVEEVEKVFGSIEAYLVTALHVDINKLRELYLED